MKEVRSESQNSFTNHTYFKTEYPPEDTIFNQTSTKTEAETDKCDSKNHMHESSGNHASQTQEHNIIDKESNAEDEQSNNRSDIKF